jgi:pimeloyl-ACP methyl ester carboxylesterase
VTEPQPLPTVLIPGLSASPRLYSAQIPHLWKYGPVTIADHTRDDTMGAIAERILATAPARFALAGLSMGGYLCFEILRLAPERVVKLALLDTSARPDTPEQTVTRREQVALAWGGRFPEVVDALFPRMVHKEHRDRASLREVFGLMAQEVGPAGFVRQQNAIMARVDSRPLLESIRCPTLVLAGDGDELTPPDRAAEIAAGIEGAKLVIVKQCGHLSTLEQPVEVTRALVEWLWA